ncbi:hypothetical protein VdG1_08719 [Verticillium dahliae VDG1]|nr:hypothetical protein VdG1_08719 [Verticillium dahliae VDG1]
MELCTQPELRMEELNTPQKDIATRRSSTKADLPMDADSNHHLIQMKHLAGYSPAAICLSFGTNGMTGAVCPLPPAAAAAHLPDRANHRINRARANSPTTVDVSSDEGDDEDSNVDEDEVNAEENEE